MSVEFRDELGKVLFYDTFHGFVFLSTYIAP